MFDVHGMVFVRTSIIVEPGGGNKYSMILTCVAPLGVRFAFVSFLFSHPRFVPLEATFEPPAVGIAGMNALAKFISNVHMRRLLGEKSLSGCRLCSRHNKGIPGF